CQKQATEESSHRYLRPLFFTSTSTQVWKSAPPAFPAMQMVAVVLLGIAVIRPARSCRSPSSVEQSPSLGWLNFEVTLAFETSRAARFSAIPLSYKEPSTGSGQGSVEGSGRVTSSPGSSALSTLEM